MDRLTSSLKKKMSIGVGNVPLHKPITFDHKNVMIADPLPGSHPYRQSALVMRETGVSGPPVATSVKHEMSERKAFIQSQTSIMTKYGPGIRMAGSEYMTSLVVPATGATRGACLYTIPVNPFVIVDARLQLASQMYTRYIFKRFRVTYEPTAGTQNNGSIMMFGDYDPKQNASLAGGDNSLRYAFTHNCKEASIWEHQSVTITDSPYDEMLYIDPSQELRWSFQGNFWCLLAGSTSNTAALEMGKFILDYEIDFAIPDYGGPLAIANPTFAGNINIPAGTAGNPIRFNGLTTGSLNLVTLLTQPSTTPASPLLFRDSGDQQLGANAFNLQIGQAYYVYTTTAGISYVFVDPSLWSQDNLAGECCIINTPITAPGNVTCNIFPLPFNFLN